MAWSTACTLRNSLHRLVRLNTTSKFDLVVFVIRSRWWSIDAAVGLLLLSYDFGSTGSRHTLSPILPAIVDGLSLTPYRESPAQDDGETTGRNAGNHVLQVGLALTFGTLALLSLLQSTEEVLLGGDSRLMRDCYGYGYSQESTLLSLQPT